MLGQFWPR